jgi:DNA adenine methylase
MVERLERLEKISNIVFTSKGYEEVELIDWAIIYCDPPYKWTATYAEWWFDHDKFWEYIRKISKTHKVFISEYTAPDDFKAIYEFSQKSSLWWWNQTHNNQPNEKLFIYNGLNS